MITTGGRTVHAAAQAATARAERRRVSAKPAGAAMIVGQIRAALVAHLRTLNVKQFAPEEWAQNLEDVLNERLGERQGTKLLDHIASEAATMAVYFHHNPPK